MFFGITDLTTYILGSIFIVLLPGPNSLFVMTLASREGVARGYRGACGIFVGDTVLMLLAATGVAGILRSTPALFMVVKVAGAGWLAWLGWGLLGTAWRTWRNRHDTASAAPAAAPLSATPFRTALIISLMNPKAILFFVSFFIQFVSPDYAHPALSFLILGSIIQVLSALYLSALIFGGAHLAEQFRERRRLAALATALTGVVFGAFAVKLALATAG